MNMKTTTEQTDPTPLLERANGELVFEQRSSLRDARPARSRLAVGAQAALGDRGAHRKQAAATLVRQLQVPMPL